MYLVAWSSYMVGQNSPSTPYAALIKRGELLRELQRIAMGSIRGRHKPRKDDGDWGDVVLGKKDGELMVFVKFTDEERAEAMSELGL